MRHMRTVADIRHANLLTLLGRYDTLQAFADAVERSSAQISQQKNRSTHSTLRRPRAMGDELARHIESRLGLPPGWMDTDHSSPDWPFTEVDRARHDRLSPQDKAFVQRQINMALADCENQPTPGGATVRTLHEPRKRYRAA